MDLWMDENQETGPMPTETELLALQDEAIENQDEELACLVAVALTEQNVSGANITALQDVVCNGDLAPALLVFAKHVKSADVDIERLFRTAMEGSGWPLELEIHDVWEFEQLYAQHLKKTA
jgi:hypothetical protein